MSPSDNRAMTPRPASAAPYQVDRRLSDNGVIIYTVSRFLRIDDLLHAWRCSTSIVKINFHNLLDLAHRARGEALKL